MDFRFFLFFLIILNCGIVSAENTPPEMVCPEKCPVKEYQVLITCPTSNSNLQLVLHKGTYNCIDGGNLKDGSGMALGCMYVSSDWDSAYQIKNSVSIGTKNMNGVLSVTNLVSKIEGKKFDLDFDPDRDGPYLSIVYSLDKNEKVDQEIWRFLFTGLEDFTQDGLEGPNTFKVSKINAKTETSANMYAKIGSLILPATENKKADDYFTGLNCTSTFTILK